MNEFDDMGEGVSDPMSVQGTYFPITSAHNRNLNHVHYFLLTERGDPILTERGLYLETE